MFISLQTVVLLIPNLQIDQRITVGLMCLGQLYADKELVSFSQLQSLYSIPKGDFYKYLQLRHWLSSGKASLLREPSLPKILLASFHSTEHKGGYPGGTNILPHPGIAKNCQHNLKMGKKTFARSFLQTNGIVSSSPALKFLNV